MQQRGGLAVRFSGKRLRLRMKQERVCHRSVEVWLQNQAVPLLHGDIKKFFAYFFTEAEISLWLLPKLPQLW